MSRAPKNRPVRTPLGARNRLGFKDLDPNYEYHVINDQDDRIDRALQAGYEHVVSDQKLGDIRVAEGTVPGAKVAKPVGNGVTGYLMRIPREYYEEDQAAKEARVKLSEEAMDPKQKRASGDFESEVYGEGLKTR